MAKKVNVGLVGYKFMGKAHSNAYSDVAMFFDMDAEPVMRAICGRNEEGVKAAAEKFDRIFEEVANENSDPFVSKMLANGDGVECEPHRSRTCNLLIKSQLLCQLS